MDAPIECANGARVGVIYVKATLAQDLNESAFDAAAKFAKQFPSSHVWTNGQDAVRNAGGKICDAAYVVRIANTAFGSSGYAVQQISSNPTILVPW
jgi:hypothetical protein